MEKLKTEDFILLAKKLATSKDFQNEDPGLILRTNITQAQYLISHKDQYHEFKIILKETQPALLMEPEKLEKLSHHELLSLFVDWNVILLEQLSLSLAKEMFCYKISPHKYGKPPDVLSSNDQQTIHNCIDYVVVFGLLMQLSPGVGSEIRNPLVKKLTSKAVKETRLLRKYLLVLMEVHSLELSSLFRNYIRLAHFNSFLAAFFEISFNPDYVSSDKVEDSEDTRGDNDDNDGSVNDYDTQPFKTYLHNLVHSTNPQFILRQLLQLLNGQGVRVEGASMNIPLWLLKECLRTLRECFLKNGGLENLILTFNEPATGENNVVKRDRKDSTVDWHRCEFIARTITHLPLASFPSERYFCNISSQIVAILNCLYNPENNTSKNLEGCVLAVPVVVKIMDYIHQHHLSIFNEKIFHVIAAPLLLMTHKQQYVDDVVESAESKKRIVEVVDEQSFTMCLETLHELLVIFHYSNSSLPLALLPFIYVLKLLHEYTYPSYLRTTTEELLQRLLDSMPATEAVAVLKKLTDERVKEGEKENPMESLDSVSFISLDDIVYHEVNPKYSFKGTLQGGVVIVEGSKEVSGSTSWDDKKPAMDNFTFDMVINILSKLSNPTIANKFFFQTLQGVTKLIQEDLTECRNVSQKLESAELKDVLVFNTKWPDNTFHILLLTALVEKLPDAAHANFNLVLIFAKAVVELVIILIEGSSKSVFHDYVLIFTASLLMQLFMDTSEITESQWEVTYLMLPNFKKLSEIHHDDHIRSSLLQTYVSIQNKRNPQPASVLEPLLKLKKSTKSSLNFVEMVPKSNKEDIAYEDLANNERKKKV